MAIALVGPRCQSSGDTLLDLVNMVTSNCVAFKGCQPLLFIAIITYWCNGGVLVPDSA